LFDLIEYSVKERKNTKLKFESKSDYYWMKRKSSLQEEQNWKMNSCIFNFNILKSYSDRNLLRIEFLMK
jgi:hypothetical protein